MQFNITIFDEDGHAPVMRMKNEDSLRKYMWIILRSLPQALLPMNYADWATQDYVKEMTKMKLDFLIEEVRVDG